MTDQVVVQVSMDLRQTIPLTAALWSPQIINVSMPYPDSPPGQTHYPPEKNAVVVTIQ